MTSSSLSATVTTERPFTAQGAFGYLMGFLRKFFDECPVLLDIDWQPDESNTLSSSDYSRARSRYACVYLRRNESKTVALPVPDNGTPIVWRVQVAIRCPADANIGGRRTIQSMVSSDSKAAMIALSRGEFGTVLVREVSP